jgi:hypothetical protein
MPSIFLNLPAPVGNGAGAAVDVSAMGAVKTIVCGGNARATITVEINNAALATDGSFAPVASFQNTGQITLRVAARWMRVRVSGYNPYIGGTPEVDVGSTDSGTQFASLPVPTGNGVGAAVDVSALGPFSTVQVGNEFRGTLIVEVSEDGVDWGQPFSFQTPGQQSQVVIAAWMRVRRIGVPTVNPGLPIVNVAAAVDGGGGGSMLAISAGTQSADTGTIAFANSNGLSFGMAGSSRITGSFDGVRSVVGAGSTATGPTISLENSNGVSFGISGQTITASVGAAGVAAIKTLSGGTTNATGPGISLADSNGVSFGVSGNTVTASIGAAAVAAIKTISGGTTNATGPGLSLADSNGMSFGVDGNTITATNDAFRSIIAGSSTALQTLSFVDGNGVSFGIAAHTITASYDGFRSVLAGTTTGTGPTLSFGNSNGVSFGVSGQTVTASVDLTSVSAIKTISAGTTNMTGPAVSFQDGSGVSFGISGNTLTAFAPNVAISAGTQSATNGTVVFADSNGVAFGMTNSTVSASVSALKTLSAGTTNLQGPGLSLADSNGVSFGASGSTITADIAAIRTVSAGTTNALGPGLSFADSNNISFGISGSTVTASAAGATGAAQATYQQFWPFEGLQHVTNLGTVQSQAYFHPMELPNLSVSQVGVLMTVQRATNVSTTATYSNLFGLYTRTGNSISLLTSVSVTGTFVANITNDSLFTGLRIVTAGFSTSLPAGDYWVANNLITAGGALLTMNAVVANGTTAAAPGYLGSSNPGTAQALGLGYGIYTALSAALPGNVAFSQISQSATSHQFLYWYGLGVSTT